MLDKVMPEHILFLDIETIPQVERLDQFSDKMQKLWNRKAEQIGKPDDSAEAIFQRAGIYAEFGKIICISAGFIYRKGKENERFFKVKSFYGDDEKQLLADFSEMLQKYMANPAHKICAHNGQEFDFPYISRRMLLNGMKLPSVLDIAGAKPWEVKDYMLDTMQLWKFGDFKHYTSLDLLCAIFNIPTPKDDIDGSQVYGVYYQQHDLERIKTYCEKDAFSVAQIFLRFKGEEIITQENFEVAG